MVGLQGSGLILCLPDNSCAWPERLNPWRGDANEQEPFPEWWERNRQDLHHLPAELCEQWIHRHWEYSPFAFLPLDTLTWEPRTFDGEELLASIHRACGGDLHPQFDYDTFQRRGGDDRHATAIALDSGTWDYPMVLLSTPNGIRSFRRELPAVRLVLVEGHQRHRYLNALHALGKPPCGPHQVYVLRSPLAGGAL